MLYELLAGQFHNFDWYGGCNHHDRVGHEQSRRIRPDTALSNNNRYFNSSLFDSIDKSISIHQLISTEINLFRASVPAQKNML